MDNEPEIYTLQDILEEEYEDDPLEDALWQNYKDTSAYAEVYADKRLIELGVDGSDMLSVDDIQNHTQQVSDIVQKLNAGRVQFVGILGGSEFRITLVFKY
jgi:hypothetical protein